MATVDQDIVIMRQALELAHAACRLGEVPVGAVITRNGSVVSSAYNQRETLHDPTAHAERLAISAAGIALGRWRLDDCTLYVSLEPCLMCAGAIILGRISRVVYGARDPKSGACNSLYRITSDRRLNHRAEILGGVLEAESREILSLFFQERRTSGMIPG